MNKIYSYKNKISQRESGIELLKIFAIFLIVISHVTRTLSKSSAVNFQEYVLLLGNATTDIQVIALNVLYQTGALGNTIFFCCSSYFLVGRYKKWKKKSHSFNM